MHRGKDAESGERFKDEAHTKDDTEAKQQIRVLKMIDFLDYVVSTTLGGNDPTAVWNKMFVSIDNIPESHKFGGFWNQFTDPKSTVLDEDA